MTAVLVSTDRVRAYRERRRNGRVQLTIEADEVALVEALIMARLLSVEKVEDRDAITSATEKLLEIFLENGR